MKIKVWTRSVLLTLLVLLLSGCASTAGPRQTTPMVDLQKARQELPENQLMDVWIELFQPGEIPQKEREALGLSEEIRVAEARYIPIHLRSVMEKTGYWGAVRVVPDGTKGAELLVQGKILRSDGEILELRIIARDASGRSWFRKVYTGEANPKVYEKLAPGSDSFETLYRKISNDLAKFRDQLSSQEVIAIRQFAEVRFAADMAPDAFAEHLRTNDKGRLQLNRLPAANDPAFERVQLIRERDFMLIDTLNGHFDNYYLQMSDPYLEWRKARSAEAVALREVKRKANTRKILGAAAIIGAIALGASGDYETRARSGTLRDVMVLGGAVAIKQGMEINAQSNMHKAVLEELGESFAAEAEPLVVEVDGEVYKLTGSAEVQYAQWRQLMREIYAAETGLEYDDG